MEIYTEKIPSWAICYLVNGDRDNLEDSEVDMIERWIDRNRYGIIFPIGDCEEYFTGRPAFGPACDVIDCNCAIIN